MILGIAGYIDNNVHGIPSGHSRLFPGWHVDQESFDELFGDKHESDQTLDLAFPTGGSLTVEDPRGDVTVNGTSDDGRVHIAEHKQVYAYSDTDADSKAQRLSPAIASEGTAISIHMAAIEGARTDLVITVPAAAAISVNAGHGDIHVASIKAPVAVTANHGDIELAAISEPATAHINGLGSSLTAHSLGGGIAIEGHAQGATLSEITGPVTLSGDFFALHLERINGTIHYHGSRTELQLARLDGEAEISQRTDLFVDQALGPLVLTTSYHNITLDRIAGDVAVTDRNGSINLTEAPTPGTITLEDRNGSVKLVLPEHSGFTAQADTSNGDVYTDFPLPTSGSESHKIINGTVGVGGPTVHVTTSNGDISIVKGTVPPLPPMPPAPPKLTLAPAAPPHAPHASHNSKDTGEDEP